MTLSVEKLEMMESREHDFYFFTLAVRKTAFGENPSDRLRSLPEVCRCRLLRRPTSGLDEVPARFEEGHSSEEKMAAVHYLRFAFSPAARDLLADPNAAGRFVVDHPHYAAETAVTPELRAELLRDLAA